MGNQSIDLSAQKRGRRGPGSGSIPLGLKPCPLCRRGNDYGLTGTSTRDGSGWLLRVTCRGCGYDPCSRGFSASVRLSRFDMGAMPRWRINRLLTAAWNDEVERLNGECALPFSFEARA